MTTDESIRRDNAQYEVWRRLFKDHKKSTGMNDAQTAEWLARRTPEHIHMFAKIITPFWAKELIENGGWIPPMVERV